MAAEPFVSHAVNLEDVVLWRALRDVADGFYIDVGASWPTHGSVTLAFSERGWSGINIEPDAEPFAVLARDRPRDVNLNVAVSNTSGELPMYFVPNSSLSTLSEDEARRREAEGRTVVRRVVPVETLASIWRAHVPAGREVQFLKVDVEGGEREVLEGLDWATMRPWIVVVEATRPHNPEPTHERWEAILLDAGYALVYRDGVNRFYLSAAHADLAPAFELPPNYWDRYVTAAQRKAERRALEAHARLAAMRASASWRVTRPLRALARRLRRHGGPSDD
jgi:FkbM family methyltransferase